MRFLLGSICYLVIGAIILLAFEYNDRQLAHKSNFAYLGEAKSVWENIQTIIILLVFWPFITWIRYEQILAAQAIEHDTTQDTRKL